MGIIFIVDIIDKEIALLHIDEVVKSEIYDISEDQNGFIFKLDNDTLWKKIQDELHGRPFNDLGSERIIEWVALGINWSIRFENDYITNSVSEEFVSALQVMLADLAGIDLGLLPVTIDIYCKITEKNKISIENIPSNEIQKIIIRLPKDYSLDHVDISVVLAILDKSSVFPSELFVEKIKQSIMEGLSDKIFSVRPYHELYKTIMDKDTFEKYIRRELEVLEFQRPFYHKENHQLKWFKGPGITYSKVKADEFNKNRYERSIKSIRFTLKRILKENTFKQKVLQLKNEGFLDWQILGIISNITINYRLEKLSMYNRSRAMMEKIIQDLIYKEETNEDDEIPISEFSDDKIEIYKKILISAVAKNWGLEIKMDTPDFNAIKKYLDTRYFNSTDDIEHLDFFK